MIPVHSVPVRMASAGLAAFVALSAFAIVQSFKEPQKLVFEPEDAIHGAAPTDEATEEHPSDYSTAVRRLQTRLEEQGFGYISLSALDNALEEKQSILNRTITVTVKDATQMHEDHMWTLDLSSNPELLPLTRSWMKVSYALDKQALKEMLTAKTFTGSQMVQDTTINGFVLEKGVKRAQADAVAHAGFEYDVDALVEEIVTAVNSDTDQITHIALYREPKVMLVFEGKTTELKLLASGLSNFTHSAENRIHNVKKAFNEQVNNTFVTAGENFSFNAVLDTPVTLEKGWVEALGLFGGGAAMTPGGGICQAATTVYRAALLGGFPLVEKRNHSLYVTYYEAFGVGMDATIFPGVHDLRFKNDTSAPIVLQAYLSGEDAYVNIYGVPDDRTVTLEGPYFVGSQPKNPNLRPLGYHDIGWVQTVTKADGSKIVKPLISNYAKPIPRYLVKMYPPTVVTGTLRTIVPVVASH